MYMYMYMTVCTMLTCTCTRMHPWQGEPIMDLCRPDSGRMIYCTVDFTCVEKFHGGSLVPRQY